MNSPCEMTKIYQVHRMKASLFHLLPRSCRGDFSVAERLKLLLRAWRGYEFYYLMDGTSLCAYTFLKRNYFGKYAFMAKDDYLINPYYVRDEYRGKGLATRMLRAVMTQLPQNHGKIWAVVKDDNQPSIKVLSKVGFQQVGYSIQTGWSHKKTDVPTHLILFSD